MWEMEEIQLCLEQVLSSLMRFEKRYKGNGFDIGGDKGDLDIFGGGIVQLDKI